MSLRRTEKELLDSLWNSGRINLDSTMGILNGNNPTDTISGLGQGSIYRNNRLAEIQNIQEGSPVGPPELEDWEQDAIFPTINQNKEGDAPLGQEGHSQSTPTSPLNFEVMNAPVVGGIDSPQLIEQGVGLDKTMKSNLEDLFSRDTRTGAPQTFEASFQEGLSANTQQATPPLASMTTPVVGGDSEQLQGIAGAGKEPLPAEEQKGKKAGFLDYLAQNPDAAMGVDLNTALFKVGQSVGFNADNLANPDARRDAKLGNTTRMVGAIGKSLLNMGRLVGAGIGHQKRLDYALDQAEKKKRDFIYNAKEGGMYQYLRNGGSIDDLSTADILTGEYLKGLPKEQEPLANAEVEKSEYIKTPDGQVQKVLGKTHAQGGEKVNLEEDTKIISNHLKVGKENAEVFRKHFDLKVKATDTFAKVVDIFTKKVGLTKLNNEQKKYFEQLEKQEEVQDTTTSALNKEFLSEKIHTIEGNKQGLLDLRAKLLDVVYEMQEAQKGGKQGSQYKFAKGGSKGKDKNRKYFTEEEAKKYDFANVNPEAVVDYGKQSRSANEAFEVYGDFDAQKRLEVYKKQLPTLFHKHFEEREDGTIVPKEGKETILNFQKDYNKYLEDTGSLFKTLGANEGAVDDYRSKLQFIDSDGVSSRKLDNRFGEVTSSRSAFHRKVLTEPQIKKLQEKGIYTARQVLDNPELVKGIVEEGDFKRVVQGLDKFKDANYVLSTEGQEGVTLFDLDKKLEPMTSGVSEGAGIPTDKIESKVAEVTLADDPSQKLAGMPTRVEGATSPQEKSIEENTTVGGEATSGEATSGEVTSRGGAPIYFPDQSAMPPDPMIPHLKIDRKYDRVEPIRETDEEAQKELFRAQDFAISQINELPDSQRRAAITNIVANTQDKVNQAAAHVGMANVRHQAQADYTNLRQSNAEEDSRRIDALGFERNQLGALDKTLADINNYFLHNQEVRMNQFRDRKSMEMLRDMYDNYTLDSEGNIVFGGTK